MKLAVFDLCGTLIRKNTLFELARLLDERTSRRIDSQFVKVIDRLLPVEVRRMLALQTLRGYTSEELDMFSRELVDALKAELRSEAMLLLNAYRECGYEIMLLSGAPECAVAAFASYLGITRFAGAKLSFTNEICDGRLLDDPRGHKSELIEALRVEAFAAVTDNKNDLKLVSGANEKHIFAKKVDESWWLSHGFTRDEVHVV
jgi:phosphoserine phosphatase